MAILGLMDEDNASITAVRVFRNMEYPNPTSLKFSVDSDWLQAGERLLKISELFEDFGTNFGSLAKRNTESGM